MIYLDTSYIAKCYLQEPGSAEVLAWIEGKSGLSCCHHGRLELVSAVKRHVRERRLSASDALRTFRFLEADERQGLWCWIPLTEDLVRRACERIRTVPDDVFLRSADALHLTCAAEHGFESVYSHDRHLLAAAPHFGLGGHDLL